MARCFRNWDSVQSKTNHRDRGKASTGKSMTCGKNEQCSRSKVHRKKTIQEQRAKKWTESC